MAVTKWIIPLATRPLGRTATSANSHVKIQDLKGQQPNRDLHSRSTPKWSEGIECTVFTSKMRIYANKQETVVCEITDNWGDFTDVCCDFTDVCRDFTDNGVPTRSVGLHKSTTLKLIGFSLDTPDTNHIVWEHHVQIGKWSNLLRIISAHVPCAVSQIEQWSTWTNGLNLASFTDTFFFPLTFFTECLTT